MRKLFKVAALSLSASLLPLGLAATAYATSDFAADIDTTLEYQISSDGSSMRYISTMVLNGHSLDDITNIELNFDLSKDGEETKHSTAKTLTTVYESVAEEKEKVDDTYYAVFKITDLTTKYTGWNITPYFTYNYSDSSTETVTASSWLIGGTRVQFINSYNWDNVFAFLFKDGVSSNGSWPGQAMTLLDAEHGVYYIDYLKTEVYDSIVFTNNDERQTEDLVLEDTIHSYSLGRMNGNGKYEGLSHTCSSHKWSSEFVSNGATHYHVCEVCGAKSKIIDNDMEPVEGENGVYQDAKSNYRGKKVSNRIYFQDSYYWGGNIYIHQWNGDAGTPWPGEEMAYFTTDMWGRNIFYTNGLGDCQNMLFHIIDGSQTHDASISATGNAYYLGNDSYVAGAYNICEDAA